MATKQDIIENVGMYSADKLAEFIKNGIITFDELCEECEGYLSESQKIEVETQLKGKRSINLEKKTEEVYEMDYSRSETTVNPTEQEERDWQVVLSSKSEALLKDFIGTYPNSRHGAEANRLVKNWRNEETELRAEEVWNHTDQNSITELEDFIAKFPNCNYTQEAKERINDIRSGEFLNYGIEALKEQIEDIRKNTGNDQEYFNLINDWLIKKRISHQNLVDLIGENHNILRSTTVKMLFDKGLLNLEDFDTAGINKDFVSFLLKGESVKLFPPTKALTEITNTSTEVYFWGIPSSGKTCALGGILSVANNGKVAVSMHPNDCQGFGYMTRLMELFRKNARVGVLPESTSTTSTYEMSFNLEDKKGRMHRLTCIDLAGEMIRCMYKEKAGETMDTQRIQTLNTLTKILVDNRTKSRKVHFFVIEYGAEDREYEGLTQGAYLNGALHYIKSTGIFKKDTDAIYLIITKIDKTKAKSGELKEILKEHISENYGGFYNGLVHICKENEINDGKVEIIPFSLGEVCFQDYCLFDDKSASKVVSILLERTPTDWPWPFNKIQKILNQ